METLLDLESLSIKEAIGHLRAVEQRKKPSPAKENADRLLLTKEEWMARMKSRDGSGSSTGAHRGGASGGKNRGGKQSTGGECRSSVGRDDVCNYCGKRGHWAKECRKKKRDEAAQGEEEEQSLLLAYCTVHDDPIGVSPTPVAIPSPSVTPRCIIHIDEQKVYADLGATEGGDHDRWVLNADTTNHMTGSREIFAELDLQICGTVKLGDGSITQIEGRGNIILTCKNGGHRTLTGVYYIPLLKASIISLGQLDETGCRVDINHYVLWIYDQRDLLAKVQRDASRLYYL
jgi:hypothetical protein